MESSARVELPAAFEEVDVDILVQLIADMMSRLMAHNDQISLSPESLTRFHSRTPPGITVLEYLRRIVKFTKVERACLLITLHYIDQICARTPLFTLSSLTCHRFVITSIAISSKALCDTFCTNNVYAKVGGIPVPELNMLEREFLRMVDWHLTVSTLRSRRRAHSTEKYPLCRASSSAHDHTRSAQCTREILQDYYVNLVRTHSTGQFVIPGDQSGSGSSDSDMDVDASRPSSPTVTSSSTRTLEASTILIDTATLSPESPRPPTIEQEMAFAAFQQQSLEEGRGR
ncbi:cyclin-domain-containing protein [Sparassis latifolia]